jgi:hypothetical protein
MKKLNLKNTFLISYNVGYGCVFREFYTLYNYIKRKNISYLFIRNVETPEYLVGVP